MPARRSPAPSPAGTNRSPASLTPSLKKVTGFAIASPRIGTGGHIVVDKSGRRPKRAQYATPAAKTAQVGPFLVGFSSCSRKTSAARGAPVPHRQGYRNEKAVCRHVGVGRAGRGGGGCIGGG